MIFSTSCFDQLPKNTKYAYQSISSSGLGFEPFNTWYVQKPSSLKNDFRSLDLERFQKVENHQKISYFGQNVHKQPKHGGMEISISQTSLEFGQNCLASFCQMIRVMFRANIHFLTLRSRRLYFSANFVFFWAIFGGFARFWQKFNLLLPKIFERGLVLIVSLNEFNKPANGLERISEGL